MGWYDDILHRNRPESANHPPMSRAERAKQFMPFATLRGYGDALADREVLSDARAVGDDEAEAQLNRTLAELRRALNAGEKPRIVTEIYETDQSLRTHIRRLAGRAERLSIPDRTLRMDGRVLPLDDVKSLQILRDES